MPPKAKPPTAITIVGDFDYNTSQVLKKTVHNLQLLYDIDSKIIHDWMNDPNFQEIMTKIDSEAYTSILGREHPILNKLLEVSHPESFVEEYMPWELEKCGQIMDEFSNGFVKYCNGHRYLHQTKETTNEIDHYFSQKSARDIIEEKIFNLKFNLYLEYTHLLSQRLIENFKQYISSLGWSTYLILEEDFNQLIDWLKKNKTAFREKRPIYSDSGLRQYAKIWSNKKPAKLTTYDE